MSGVDDRIVSMQFDNAAFERKMSDTLKSLDKLKASLDFSNSKRGIEDFGKTVSNFSMAGMASAVEGVGGKFLALTTIAVTSLATITTHAVTAGARMLKSFSLDPIIDGFREFETNIGSIQTILANTSSKGTGLKDVNDALDQLNQYSDKTIYNFSQMTRNIGTFTAAGIDLDSSVSAIKGISNLAAISGSSAEQAATAMYQLSQALASGTVKLIDWNSVVNAGMGGEVFQKALFESGKAMKTLTDVPAGQTFEEWKKAGNSFRESLESGWITTEVLTNTLKGFTGDLTEAQIMAMGYTKAQAQEIMKLGKIGLAAATEVKTLTQLIGTVKEAIGSGWSSSFRILIGDFEESKQLFTNISNAIGKMVGESADARNKLLEDWKKLGGRTTLLEGFKDAISGIGTIIAPVREAFRDIFPPVTAKLLIDMTKSFADFAESLKIGGETADKIKSIFSGLFGILEIGWVIFKEVLGLIGEIVREFSGAGGEVFDFAANTGDALTRLNDVLVKGGGIHDFFLKLRDAIHEPREFVDRLKHSILDFFDSFKDLNVVEEGLDRIGSRFEHLQGLAEKLEDVWSWFGDRLEGVRNVLDQVWHHLSTWFSELGQKLAAVIEPGDFDAAVDTVNVGLLGGIALILKKFLNQGLKLDFSGGLIEKIRDTFNQLTGTLKSMQTELKAKALLEIAGAVGILTASVVVLSLIDSKALTKALIALTVGFGQLVGAMAVMDKLSTGGSAVKLGIMAGGMILLATAVGILSIAVKNMSDLDWDELAKGLIGVTVLLLGLSAATKLIAADTSGMIRAGLAMSAIAVGLLILSEAVKSFGDMSWEEMGKGLIGVAVGLGILVVGMSFMPPNMLASGVALIAIATGLRILAEAVQAFSGMSWSELGKGFVAIGGGLLIIAGAMNLMPPHMVLMATGILIISVALNIMAKAVESMGALGLDEIVKGLGAFAAMLLILAGALALMNGTLSGAAALLIVSGAMLILTKVLKELSQLSIAELVTGLAAIAGVLVILGLGALILQPLIPALLGLGIALGLIGVSFALFGLGAMLVAKAFEVMANSGKAGAKALVEIEKIIQTALPAILGAIVKSIGELASEIGAAAGLVVKAAGVIISHLLDTIIELTPKIAKAIVTIILEGLKLIRDIFPEVLTTGIDLLMKLLEGIEKNADRVVTAGSDALVAFLKGVKKNINKVADAATDVAVEFISGIDDNALRVVRAAADMIIDFLNGLADTVREKSEEFRKAGLNIVTAIIDGATGGMLSKAGELKDKLVGTFKDAVGGVLHFLDSNSPSKRFFKIGGDMLEGTAQAFDKDTSLTDSVVTRAEKIVRAFQDTLSKIPESLDEMENLNPVITPVLDLTKVQASSKSVGRLFGRSLFAPSVSIDQARSISAADDPNDTDDTDDGEPREVRFEQNIYAPEALSTNEIYRNTKSQIAMAKEELKIS